ncbi:MAG: hypothetical protein NTV61_09400 [Candidatus Bathyarchaeota archaeon]|nr:hypothetical protein [Candidatus Bathyarchaeota archaeon]
MDLILNVLKEHEKNLDSLVLQLGETVSQQNTPGKISPHGLSQHKIVLRKWPEFRERCLHSDTLTFDIEGDKFKVFSLKNDVFFIYFETIPEVAIKMEKNSDKIIIESGDLMSTEDTSYAYNGRLQCGLSLNVKKLKVNMPNGDTVQKIMYKVDPEKAKLWLSEELKTEKRSIMFGWIEL